MRAANILGAVAVSVALTGPAWAHDFWVEPASYEPTAGQELDLRLRVGDDFEGEEFPRSLRHVERFEVLGPVGPLAVSGEHMEFPAGRVTPTETGLHWVVYRSRDSIADVESEKFGPYLEEEGNDRWLNDWKALDLGQDKPVKESFSRCIKCLLRVRPAAQLSAAQPRAAQLDAARPSAARLTTPAAADVAPARFDSRVGLKLEIVLGADPAALAPGAALPVSLLWDGQPLADAQVTARSSADPAHPLKVRTDAHGQALLRLDAPGRWLLKSVHLERTPPGEAAVYRSTWSALTLEMPTAAERVRK